MKKKNIIEFVDLSHSVPEYLYPKPAKRDIPDWYKSMPSVAPDRAGVTPLRGGHGTVKKCMPFFDAVSAGYLIYLTKDLYIDNDQEYPQYKRYFWPDIGQELIGFHSHSQIFNYPDLINDDQIPKFYNPWSIFTPKGYSTMFLSPSHRDIPFRILEGIVDTDKHRVEVNFPFVLKDPAFTGLIPAGTPIAQVIPFKREVWNSDMRPATQEDAIVIQQTDNAIFSKLRNAYKSLFWERKEFN